MAQYDPQRHHRHSIRLKGYDYSSAGAYFVTICTWQHMCTLGEVVDDVMQLNPAGRIASEQWLRLDQRFLENGFPASVVMPNHVHGIVVIHGASRDTGVISYDHSNGNNVPHVIAGSLGAIIRAYKASVSSRINALQGISAQSVWQHNYYDHIIRNEADLQRIENYILDNPARWAEDQLHPSAPPNNFNKRTSK
jgi:putative transposase